MQSFWDILLKKTFDSVPKNNTVLLHAVTYLLYDVRTTYFLFKSIDAVKAVRLASAVLHNTQWLRKQVMINITIMERVLSRDGTQHFSIKTLSQIYLFALEKCDSTMK